MSPFMAGRLGDHRERDMQHSEPLHSFFAQLYADWDAAIAELRERARREKTNITRMLTTLRKVFDARRLKILSGVKDHTVKKLEAYFEEYRTQLIFAGGTTEMLVEARKECDNMIEAIERG